MRGLTTHLRARKGINAPAIPFRALGVALLGLTTWGATPVAAQVGGSTTFSVLVRGANVGSERVTVTQLPTGWQIRSTGELRPPIALVTSSFEMVYGPDWQPRTLAIEGTIRGQLFTLATTFGETSASSEVLQAGQRASGTQDIAARSVVLPNNFFAAYTALAARLSTLAVGVTVPIYIAPEANATATIESVTPRRIVTPEGAHDLRDFMVRFDLPGGPTAVSIWVDERGGLARVALPASSVVAVRSDLATVRAREEKVSNPGDESVFIGAAGFNLGATITKPAGDTPRPRVVILVAGSGPQDRDQSLHGVTVFGQLAGDLAQAGFFVVRYDKRGQGQSGGRTENATLEDYAADVRNIVSWLRRRKDVDADRIAVLSHGDGAAVALIAARREGRIKAVGLLGSPAGTGREVTLAEQQRELASMSLSDAEKEGRVALQNRIMDAVVSGEGWDTLPPSVRQQADTPWFRTWLEFDPADVIRRIDEPILILQGSRDAEVPPGSADALEALAAARDEPALYTRKVLLPDLNHLLVPAATGDEAEYETLLDRTVSATVSAAIVEWLNQIMAPRR